MCWVCFPFHLFCMNVKISDIFGLQPDYFFDPNSENFILKCYEVQSVRRALLSSGVQELKYRIADASGSRY